MTFNKLYACNPVDVPSTIVVRISYIVDVVKTQCSTLPTWLKHKVVNSNWSMVGLAESGVVRDRCG